MHLGTAALLDFYRAHREDDDLVLATVIATEGSTYRKPGAMMLVARDGSFEGLISGGCLEGDLLHHADEVFRLGAAKRVTYDLHAEDDLVWSLGLGCDGVIHLFLQPLLRSSHFGFLEHLERAQESHRAALLALVTQTTGEAPLGAYAFLDTSDISDGDAVLSNLVADLAADWPSWRYRHVRFGADDGIEAIVIHVPPTPRVLICGAGPDAIPLVRVLLEVGWEVTISDHRPAYARADRFPPACSILQVRPERLAEAIDPSQLDGAVIMSHHLENDAAYLACLAPHDIPYIGLLGPRARRLRLLQLAECPERAVFGPSGLDIGAELPASIALSIAAEIHAVLNGRDGTSLTEVNT